MESLNRASIAQFVRASSLLAAALLFGAFICGGASVYANHPVLVEGNCDSPSPGTTVVERGTCGDYDGDGRIGTAEDTDGADRIFGTLQGALGPGTGAAAGTGANQNGTIIIVRSGRFTEPPQPFSPPSMLFIGVTGVTPSIGNVTIEAAPGVVANIDAVLQGDPAGGNNTRQAGTAIYINRDASFSNTVVTLRNLTFRNWDQAVDVAGFGNELIDNCRFEHNLNTGLSADGSSNVAVTRSQFDSQGRRIGTAPNNTPGLDRGHGILVNVNSNGVTLKVYDTTFTNNTGAGIRNTVGTANRVTLFKVASYFNGTDISGAFTIAPDHNYSN